MALLETDTASIDLSNGAKQPARMQLSALILLAATTFLGAFLLFQVQPLIAKFILPWFGGAPAVWTTCLLFFQVLLLVGYAYAHVLTKYVRPRGQALSHIVLLLAALAFLPIAPASHWKPAAGVEPEWRILLLLVSCIGVPYLLLSATGPLLQAWFSLLNPGAVPYRLYALSNAGSLLALISFPFLFEPALSRHTLAASWAWGFGFYVLCCGLCAWRLWKGHNVSRTEPAGAKTNPLQEDLQPPGTTVRLLWFALPACASILLLATTNRMCQDIAVVPFLWVLPLSLYLLTFILCFDRPLWYLRRTLTLLLFPVLFLLCGIVAGFHNVPILFQIAIHLVLLFICCMICHGELYRLKPHPRFLTSFYLSIAAGGAVGGVFVAVAAPAIFDSYAELNWGILLILVLILFVHLRERSAWNVLGRSWRVWPLTLASVVLLLLAFVSQSRPVEGDPVLTSRNFYGVLRVHEFLKEKPDSHGYTLSHGNITHGLQFTHPAKSGIPTAYFHEQSGIGFTMNFFPRTSPRHVGIVGLGIGTLAAYGKRGDAFRFYEINPQIRDVAQEWFTYIKASNAQISLVMGDGRLSLENEPPQGFDILVLDAFSGDAVPVHLLTLEAFDIYLRHLKPDGVIAVNITNRHLDLFPLACALASHFGFGIAKVESNAILAPPWVIDSRWVLLSRNQEFLDALPIPDSARGIPPDSGKSPPLLDR